MSEGSMEKDNVIPFARGEQVQAEKLDAEAKRIFEKVVDAYKQTLEVLKRKELLLEEELTRPEGETNAERISELHRDIERLREIEEECLDTINILAEKHVLIAELWSGLQRRIEEEGH